MRSILSCLGLLSIGGAWCAACGDASAGDLFPGDAGIPAVLELGGRGGRGGLDGRSGAGGRSGTGGVAEPPDAGMGGADAGGGRCQADADCLDENECSVDRCIDGACSNLAAPEGSACGSRRNGECTRPDTCDGAGVCVANDEPDGAPCEEGACAAGVCAAEPSAECPVAVVDALPFATEWRTVGGVDLYAGGCDEENTPDFAVVFTAPTTAVYRFEAAGVVGEDDPESDPGSELADSVLTIAAGACGGAGAEQLACNDDRNNGILDSRIDLELEEGQTVTVYANEFSEVVPGGGSGTLTIRLLSD